MLANLNWLTEVTKSSIALTLWEFLLL